jgi:hypothetical protein
MGMTEAHAGLEQPIVSPAAKQNKPQNREPKASQLKANKPKKWANDQKRARRVDLLHGGHPGKNWS